MLHVAIALAFLASTFASPLFHYGDIKPEPGCHYNISAVNDFKTPLVPRFEIFTDSITSSLPLDKWTCSKWDGVFTDKGNHITQIDFQWEIVALHETVLIKCTGENFADQPADFLNNCYYHPCPSHRFLLQMRVAAVGNGYILMTFCSGKTRNTPEWSEYMVFFSTKKSGLSPAVRAMLTKKLVDAGWDRALIKHVPTQNGC